MSAKRIVIRVRWRPNRGWQLLTNRQPPATIIDPVGFGWPWRADAIASACAWARELKRCGHLAQVVLHTKNGRIAWERTYGRDPKRRKG